jgi:predicted peroxiredoxin
MNNKVLVLLSCGTDNTNRSTRGIHLATVAHKEGKARKIDQQDLIEGASLAPASEMIHMACDSTVISL